MKTIVVTGATSFIGMHLIEELVKTGDRIVAVIRPNSSNKEKLLRRYPALTCAEADLAHMQELTRWLDRVDVCYHLAWDGTRVPQRYDEALQGRNYENSIETFRVMKNLGCRVFIGMGSQAEYGACKEKITEETEPVPNTAYGACKLQTCNTLLQYNGVDTRVVWVRLFSIFGAGDYSQTLLMQSLKQMLAGETINMTLGTQFWNYLYVKDLARILVLLGSSEKAEGIFNLASDDTRMLKEYIQEMKEVLHSKSQIHFGAVPYRAEGVVSIMPVITKLKRVTGPGFSFTRFGDAVREMKQEIFS